MSEKVSSHHEQTGDQTPDSLSSLISDLKEDLEQKGQEPSNQLETQNPQELLDKYEKIIQRQDFVSGGRNYFALTKDIAKYTSWFEATKQNDFDLNSVGRKIKSSINPNHRPPQRLEASSENDLEEVWNKETPQIFMQRDQQRLKHMSSIENRIILHHGGGNHFVDSTDPVYNPIQLLESVKRQRERELGFAKEPRDTIFSSPYRYPHGDLSPAELDNKAGFHRYLHGISVAALEAGDTTIAAKALAFAHNIQETPPSVLELVKAELFKLNSEKKQAFITTFEEEKKSV